MLDIALFIVLCVLAVRAFIALRRESAVRREYGQSAALDTLVLLYPLAPLWLLGGPYRGLLLAHQQAGAQLGGYARR